MPPSPCPLCSSGCDVMHRHAMPHLLDRLRAPCLPAWLPQALSRAQPPSWPSSWSRLFPTIQTAVRQRPWCLVQRYPGQRGVLAMHATVIPQGLMSCLKVHDLPAEALSNSRSLPPTPGTSFSA